MRIGCSIDKHSAMQEMNLLREQFDQFDTGRKFSLSRITNNENALNFILTEAFKKDRANTLKQSMKKRKIDK